MNILSKENVLHILTFRFVHRFYSFMNKKILIADDDADLLEALTMLFRLEGYTVSSSLTGWSIRDIRKHSPALILLDVLLSGQDGRAICREIKSHEDTQKIPVILISSGWDLQESVKDSCADAFREKPFDIPELLQLVKQYTGWPSDR